MGRNCDHHCGSCDCGGAVRALKAASMAVAILLLAGCGIGYATTEDEIAEQVKFKTACEEAGGRISYNGIPQMICMFAEEPE